MPSVTIKWGKFFPEEERPVTIAEFETQAELDAYMEGIDDMDGWMDYTIIEDEENNVGPVADTLSNVPITP